MKFLSEISFSHQMPDMNGKRREKENGITHTLNINEF